MARYKPKTTTAKMLAGKTSVAKSETNEGRWVIAMDTAPGKVLPGISLDDAGSVVEAPDFKLRREATEAYDSLLEALDQLDQELAAAVPLEDAVRYALEAMADRLADNLA